jgi:carbon starvation protein CstA
MSTDISDPGEGHSVAAWTAVIIMLVAISVGTAAFFFDIPWLVWTSAAFVPIGAIVGWILGRTGYGPKPHVAEH